SFPTRRSSDLAFMADRTARILTPYVPALVVIALANLAFIDGRYSEDGANAGMLAFLGNLALLQDHSAFQFLDLVGIELAWRIRPYNSAEPFWTVAIRSEERRVGKQGRAAG